MYLEHLPARASPEHPSIHTTPPPPAMAAFAKPSYTSAAFRPTYPPSLYIRLHLYHSPIPSTTHLDLGTGPGTVLSPLSPPFKRTYAVDPSPTMLALARSLLPPRLQNSTTFHLSPAEDLSFLPPSSISLVTAAQAAHWFRTPDIWNELARVCLRPGGTVAFWGYTDLVLPDCPRASIILANYSCAAKHWGSYWAQPGRSRVQGHLRALRPPNDGRWERIERWEYEPSFSPAAAARSGLTWPWRILPETPQEARAHGPGIFGKSVFEGEGMLKKEMKVWELEEYVRAWPAVHDWKQKNPDRIRLKEGGKGDIVDDCFAEMREAEGWVAKARKMGLKKEGGWKEFVVEVEWGHGMLFCKRTEKE
ncbi:S-adenosyl-L-methionine-dependent methyltransferase [Tirmania nivea]|nr:S-adenosyl-L-methionine-dependent methyltransferase [Tirmania nivea]